MSGIAQALLGGYGLVGYDSYTKLMLHMDGVDGGTVFTDSATGKTVSATNATISTTNQKFDSNAYFNGSANLKLADHDDWNFGANNFTIDFWICPTATPTAYTTFVAQWQIGTTTSDSFFIGINNTSNSIIFYVRCGSTLYSASTAYTWVLNTWYHIAAIRDSGGLKLYINGSLAASSTTIESNSLNDGTFTLSIGSTDANAYYFTGRIDELRVSKGIARWTSAFTPPSAPYSP